MVVKHPCCKDKQTHFLKKISRPDFISKWKNTWFMTHLLDRSHSLFIIDFDLISFSTFQVCNGWSCKWKIKDMNKPIEYCINFQTTKRSNKWYSKSNVWKHSQKMEEFVKWLVRTSILSSIGKLTEANTLAISNVPTVSMLAAMTGMPSYVCLELRKV